MRRYAVMAKARDADVIGILVGTLGVGEFPECLADSYFLMPPPITASYLPLISHLRKRITTARRKTYTISVGKLNPAKLANFPEIECFVLVACPENSIVESKVDDRLFTHRYLITDEYLGIRQTDRHALRIGTRPAAGNHVDREVCP